MLIFPEYKWFPEQSRAPPLSGDSHLRLSQHPEMIQLKKKKKKKESKNNKNRMCY